MYRLDDVEDIKKNISKIQEKSLIEFKTKYEPTISEYKETMNYVLEFIKEKKKIIYGGYAQNKLIQIKNPDDVFYREIDTPDIEFYSFEPIKDIVDLCDFLYEKNVNLYKVQKEFILELINYLLILKIIVIYHI